MRVVTASAVIEDATPDAIERIERVARTCYRSEDRIAPGSADKLVRAIRDKGHLAMLDHASASVRFVVDRGISHEIVRHRIGVGYAQESTRYVGYDRERFGGELEVIEPRIANEDARRVWFCAMLDAERAYLAMRAAGASPQEARAVLPHSVKTELVATGSFTYWRHFFALRCDPAAHPQMREVTIPLRDDFVRRWPAAFDDLH